MWKRLRIALAVIMVAGLSLLVSMPATSLDMNAVSVNITITATPLLAPTVTNGIGASLVTATIAHLNGGVTSTGNENPLVVVFLGISDGGTVPALWDANFTIGVEPLGTFYYDANSLSPTTTYYYRMRATNGGGVAWAPSSANFTTTVLFNPTAGFTVTDLGAITVTANWTRGAGSTYTMIRAKRNDYPASITDGELIYYGDGESVNSTGYAMEPSVYRFVAISFLADNITYNSSFTQASIGGEGMTDIATSMDSLTAMLKVVGELGFGAFIIIGLLALALWKRDVIWYSASGLACLVIGLGWIGDHTGIAWAVIAVATFQLLEAVFVAGSSGGVSKGISQFKGITNTIKGWF